MAMRYHWGLGIGHKYSHDQEIYSQKYSAAPPSSDAKIVEEVPCQANNDPPAPASDAEKDPSLLSSGQSTEVLPAPSLEVRSSILVPADSLSEKHDPELEDEDQDYESAESDHNSDSDSSSFSSDADDEETLELYETYHLD